MAAQVRQPLREARSRMQGSRSVSHPSLDFSGGRRLCPDSPATCIDLFVWYQETGFFLVLRRDGNGGVAVVEKRCFILWPATTTNNLSPCLRDFNFFSGTREETCVRQKRPGIGNLAVSSLISFLMGGIGVLGYSGRDRVLLEVSVEWRGSTD